MAVVATSGHFTKAAKEYAERYKADTAEAHLDLHLWDREYVEGLIDSLTLDSFVSMLRPKMELLAEAALAEVRRLETAREEKQALEAEPPICIKPRCGPKMVIRDGVNGVFLGCPRYPKIKGTRNIPSLEKNFSRRPKRTSRSQRR